MVSRFIPTFAHGHAQRFFYSCRYDPFAIGLISVSLFWYEHTYVTYLGVVYQMGCWLVQRHPSLPAGNRPCRDSTLLNHFFLCVIGLVLLPMPHAQSIHGVLAEIELRKRWCSAENAARTQYEYIIIISNQMRAHSRLAISAPPSFLLQLRVTFSFPSGLHPFLPLIKYSTAMKNAFDPSPLGVTRPDGRRGYPHRAMVFMRLSLSQVLSPSERLTLPRTKAHYYPLHAFVKFSLAYCRRPSARIRKP